MSPNKEQISLWFRSLQDDICKQLESLESEARFKQDLWSRSEGGGGRTRIINGMNIQKGGVNFSEVHGPLPKGASKSLGVEGTDFYATGVSIVLHPLNPHVPIIHMNVRYFEMDEQTWWFGGGIDLTPHYIRKDDARFFHRALRDVCDRQHKGYYSKFKKWADEYFYIPHRQETRGIGGIFFDRLTANEVLNKEQRWAFVKDVGALFAKLYLELNHRNQDKPFTEREKKWQALRRSRYAEFNLVWDRGTKFGLHTGGRTESILMSLPPSADWVYDHQAIEGSAEAFTQSMLKQGIDWQNMPVS